MRLQEALEVVVLKVLRVRFVPIQLVLSGHGDQISLSRGQFIQRIFFCFGASVDFCLMADALDLLAGFKDLHRLGLRFSHAVQARPETLLGLEGFLQLLLHLVVSVSSLLAGNGWHLQDLRVANLL